METLHEVKKNAAKITRRQRHGGELYFSVPMYSNYVLMSSK